MLCVLDLMPITLDPNPLIVCDEKQDYGFYGGGGGGGQGSRMYRNAQRAFNGGNEFLLEPSTPLKPGNSRPRKNNGGGGGGG